MTSRQPSARITRLTIDYPSDADAWFGLGEALFHLNPLRGRSAIEARDAFLRVFELDPRHVEAIIAPGAH